MGDPRGGDPLLSSKPEDDLVRQAVHHRPQCPLISDVPFCREPFPLRHLEELAFQEQLVSTGRELSNHYCLDLEGAQCRHDPSFLSKADLGGLERKERRLDHIEDPGVLEIIGQDAGGLRAKILALHAEPEGRKADDGDGDLLGLLLVDVDCKFLLRGPR